MYLGSRDLKFAHCNVCVSLCLFIYLLIGLFLEIKMTCFSNIFCKVKNILKGFICY